MTTPTITGVRVRAVDVPLPKPHPTAAAVLSTAPLALVDLTLDTGVVGRSYAFTYSALALPATVKIIESVGTLLTGEPLVPQRLHAMMTNRFRLLGAQGLVQIAIGTLDMALWDALAVAHGVPLCTLLGGAPRTLPAYASLGMMSPDEAVREARDAVGDGFRAVKFKIGGASVHDDVAFVAAVRAAVGPSIELAVDYNQSLGPAEAIRRGTALAPFDLAWIEEPCRYDDDDGHARVAAALATPILFGENAWSPSELARSVDANACDEVMLDVMKIGGVTGWMRAGAIADAASLRVSSHLFTEFSAQLLAVTPTARYVEWLDLVSPILQTPLVPAAGAFTLDERPGAGLVWDEDAVSRYAVR